MNARNPFLTVPVPVMDAQEGLHGHAKQLVWTLRTIEAALSRGIPWNHLHASEWAEAKRIADRIKERYGDLTQEQE